MSQLLFLLWFSWSEEQLAYDKSSGLHALIPSVSRQCLGKSDDADMSNYSSTYVHEIWKTPQTHTNTCSVFTTMSCWMYMWNLENVKIAFLTIQLYCPCGEIPLAAIWTWQTIKHQINILEIITNQNQKNAYSMPISLTDVPCKILDSYHLPSYEPVHIKTEICPKASVIACTCPHLSIYNTHTHPHTPPSVPPTITY